MIPRGEVGLIFASIGLQNRVIEGNLYAAIVFVVIVSTFMTPPLLRMILLRSLPQEGGEEQETHPVLEG
jgi:Kef-type K+ transport system membrane component KefB